VIYSLEDDVGVSCQNPVTTAPLAVDRIFPRPALHDCHSGPPPAHGRKHFRSIGKP